MDTNQKIKLACKRAGISQNELARRIAVSLEEEFKKKGSLKEYLK